MATRDIRTHTPVTACDVCGRTLLRGERAEVFIAGGERRNVCELCKTRALHEGWVREGTVPDWGGADAGREHGPSLLRRLRGRRGRTGGRGGGRPNRGESAARDGRREERGGARGGDGNGYGREPEAADAEYVEYVYDDEAQYADGVGLAPPADPAAAEFSERWDEPPAPVPAPPLSRESRATPRRASVTSRSREPRHVRAVPTSPEQKRAAAMDHFNASEHPRTIAGVARSLGAPQVAAEPAPERPSLVRLTVTWELCWYRYEVDLADEMPVVRATGQGYELDDLEPWEREPVGLMDELGSLVPRS